MGPDNQNPVKFPLLPQTVGPTKSVRIIEVALIGNPTDCPVYNDCTIRMTFLFILIVRFALIISCILIVLFSPIILSHYSPVSDLHLFLTVFPYRTYCSYLYIVCDFLLFNTINDFPSAMFAFSIVQ